MKHYRPQQAASGAAARNRIKRATQLILACTVCLQRNYKQFASTAVKTPGFSTQKFCPACNAKTEHRPTC
ncbi:MAG: 50S ribosomal protein L33 [Vampirovibrionales bacterium]|nr:50S ribosomal protein L33 [Vampirovibrionales bacterium]